MRRSDQPIAPVQWLANTLKLYFFGKGAIPRCHICGQGADMPPIGGGEQSVLLLRFRPPAPPAPGHECPVVPASALRFSCGDMPSRSSALRHAGIPNTIVSSGLLIK